MPARSKIAAYTLPFVVFVAFLGLNSALKKIDNQLWLARPEYWTYPLQTILCGLLLVRFRPQYELERPRGPGFALLVGVFVFALWISPQALFGFAPRTTGFNPLLLGAHPVFYWLELGLRFVRLVVVVPLIEEIFWRGFFLRFLIDEDFERVPIGAFSWLSFAAVSVAFALSHSAADWPAALIAGALYNAVAYYTKSLSSCILAHSVTNLALGGWIMQTKQWGFW